MVFLQSWKPNFSRRRSKSLFIKFISAGVTEVTYLSKVNNDLAVG